MNKLLLIVIGLIICIYIRYNLKYNDAYEILQAKPQQLTPKLLHERNPIVVESLGHMSETITASFKYLYLYKKESIVPIQEFITNTSRYCVIQNNDAAPVEVELLNPKYKIGDNYQSVSIRLYAGNILVVPMYWRLRSTVPIGCVFLYDTFSAMYQALPWSRS
jgi:hypothetical protein